MEEKEGQDLIKDERKTVFYVDKENNREMEIILQNANVWINVENLAKLFQVDRTGIVRHIQHIYEKGELAENSTCAFFAQVRKEGERSVTRNMAYYNLDMIIAISYRVNSKAAIEFRAWANQVTKEAMTKKLAKELLIEGKRLTVWTKCWQYIRKKIEEWRRRK